MFDQNGKIYKVSELTGIIKEILESSFITINVEGELSNFRPSSTGHWYFTLKDEDAMLQAVMFRGRTAAVDFMPSNGQMIKVKGSISVYAKRGSYQIICDSMEKSGEGDILAMLEKRKQKLAAEGLFDSDRKKEIPPFPSRVAVITSPTGAALRDILQVLGRRNAGADIVILPVPVQGENAGKEIAAQIKRANIHHLGDVIITGRGGGSLEDLLPFSEEEVVYAVAESEIPVISAVGHEIDISLSDLAADLRAPTPSAAAEMVSVSRDELAEQVDRLKESMLNRLAERTSTIRLLLNQFRPENLEREFRQIMQPFQLRLDDAKEESIRIINDRVRTERHRIELIRNELENRSPAAILKRGYAVITDAENGEIIKSAGVLETGQNVRIRFADSTAAAEIKGTENEQF